MCVIGLLIGKISERGLNCTEITSVSLPSLQGFGVRYTTRRTSFMRLQYQISFPTILQDNTFNCILASDGDKSYVLMMYSSIDWTATLVKNDSTNATLPAWLGFSAGDGIRYTSITDTFSISVGDISSTSNIKQSGVWIFRVDGNSTVSGGE